MTNPIDCKLNNLFKILCNLLCSAGTGGNSVKENNASFTFLTPRQCAINIVTANL